MVAPEVVLLRLTHYTYWPLPSLPSFLTNPRNIAHYQRYLTTTNDSTTTMETADARTYVTQVLTHLHQIGRPTIAEQLIALYDALPTTLKPNFLFDMPRTIANFQRKLSYEISTIYPPIRLLPVTSTTTVNAIPSCRPSKRKCPPAPRLCYNCREPGHEVKHCLLQYHRI